MQELIVKNFALFKETTSFKFNPLTLLIGANGSGKSSLIKLLNLIQHNNRFHLVNRFNLKNYSSQVYNPEKPFVVSYQVANNLFCEKKVEIYYDEYEPTEPCISYFEREITYVNENYDLVLGSKPQTIDSIVKLTITIDVELFYKILLENNLKEFRDKLMLSDIPEKKLSFEIKIDKEVWNDKSFEIWFFKIALFKLFKSYASNLIILEDEFNKEIINLFLPLNVTNSKNTDENNNLLNLDIVRLGDIGEPKAIFNNDDNFGKILSELDYCKNNIPFGFNPIEFLNFWVKQFFGNEAEFTFNKLDKNYEFYEVKLNGKNMPEQGTGMYRIIYLICQLSLLCGGDLISKFEFIDNTKKVPFIKRKFLVIEEPETNLHPDFQVKLAEMIFDLTQKINSDLSSTNNFIYNSNYNIIIETHSEYMIRTFQYLVAKNTGIEDQVGIINFGSDDNAGKVKHISIRPNGGLSDNFYSGFFNYSEDLRLKLDAVNNKLYN